MHVWSNVHLFNPIISLKSGAVASICLALESPLVHNSVCACVSIPKVLNN